MKPSYWNPLPTARRLTETESHLDAAMFTGKWEERNWRNVPGPFYAGETDSLAIGRLDAPHHISYDDDHGGGFGGEFVFRQPVDEGEVFDMLCGASLELCQGYNWDGDDHWTVEAVRDWWRDRGRVREWAVDIAADWGADTHPHWGYNADPRYLGHYHDAAQGHRDFAAYIDDGLEAYLRGYLFWLEHRREPKPGQALPDL
ncbi:ferredoxin [Streptomyces sp. NBC_00335]|uniref:ferredoxin n=1 Tax=unclassified Streptomyces TaxID=2593676 RepID=UPI002250D856|nr:MULTISPECIES: ferredoxin [unclassified Streptomyces]MCX5405054.1 ferredoxin [Streptomyces sp. NBC_00086]